MIVTILGAGHGGISMAGDLTLAGHEVRDCHLCTGAGLLLAGERQDRLKTR